MGAAATILLPQISRPGGSRPGRRALQGRLKFLCPQTAAHRVDHVIPQVPVQQWGLSLPVPLRVLLAAQPELVTRVP